MKPYEDLPLLPHLMAEIVCSEEYTGHEIGDRSRSPDAVAKTEAKRARMIAAEVTDFAGIADHRCREAYKAKAPWFLYCVNSKSNKGRETLYNWIRHWLSAYLDNPERFRQQSGMVPNRKGSSCNS